MNDQQRHEMVLETTHPTGVDEWYCPTCGRRMLITWEPQFKRTLLEVGQDGAIHSASKSGLQMESLQVSSAEPLAPDEDTQSSDDDPRMGPWLAWMKKVDFESLWDDED